MKMSSNETVPGTPVTHLGGLRIQVEPPGTVIRDERTGEAKTLTEGDTILAGNVLYVTEAVYQRLLKECTA